jgi:hypothetical protein
VSQGGETTLPHLVAETADGLAFKLKGAKKGFTFETKERKWFTFAGDSVKPLELYADSGEDTQNGAKYKKTMVLLAHAGGRVGIGGEAKSHHNLYLSGTGAMISGGSVQNRGVLAFSNDGGGAGFQMDYFKGKMMLGSLPPTAHLKKSTDQQTYMTFTDSGFVGIGTDSPSASLSIKSKSGIKVENKAGASWTYNVADDGSLEFLSNKGGFFSVDNDGGMHLNKKKTVDYKFEVSGKGLRLQGDSTGQAPLLFAPDAGGKGFRMDYQNEKMFLGHESGKRWHMVLADSGMVGVGTTTPVTGLHVKHDKGIAIEHGGKQVHRWEVATQPKAELSFSFMGKSKVVMTSTGNVGIGTEKPSKTLHVEGDVFVAGKLQVDNWFSKKSKKKAERNLLTESEALIQLDEHVAGRAGEDHYGIVDSEHNPADYIKMMAVMHKVLQSHQEEIKNLKAKVQELEKR